MKAPYGELSEDHPGAALIQPGGTVICQNEWFCENRKTIRVEPRELTLSSLFGKKRRTGVFFVQKTGHPLKIGR